MDPLGFASPDFPPREHERHTEADLNDAGVEGGLPPPTGDYDLVVLAEVLEHLHAAPRPVLQYLCGYLNESGSIIIQTPNALALGKRLRMLRGLHPYAEIREDRRNPGHFREYTLAELQSLAALLGLEAKAGVYNYFRHHEARARAIQAVSGLLPRSFRAGIMMVVRKRTGLSSS